MFLCIITVKIILVHQSGIILHQKGGIFLVIKIKGGYITISPKLQKNPPAEGCKGERYYNKRVFYLTKQEGEDKISCLTPNLFN